jgi:tetratricopeptide (TPR) repeat protein
LRYFEVRDADDAFTEGDYQTALALYREAAESSALQDAEGFSDPAELRAYARFRIGLVKAIQGDADGALAAVDSAIAANPNALHSQMAAQFRLGYKKVKHVSAGCAAARDFIHGHLDAFTGLWDYGYANPTFQPDALCPS